MIAHSLSCEIKRRGIKQTTIARELNVSDTWVSLRLSGKSGTVEDLEAIASVCGLTARWVDYQPTQTSDILK